MNQNNMIFELDRLMRVMRRGKGKGRGHKHGPHRGSHRLLRVINDHPLISSKELAEQIDIRVSSLNERLARLIDQGYVQRVPLESDKRINGLELTDLGKETLTKSVKEREKFHQELESILTPAEQEQLSELLKKLSDGLSERP